LSRLQAHVNRLGLQLFPLSAATGEGVPPLLEALWTAVAGRRDSDGARPDNQAAVAGGTTDADDR
jgi:hypothetical protein